MVSIVVTSSDEVSVDLRTCREKRDGLNTCREKRDGLNIDLQHQYCY